VNETLTVAQLQEALPGVDADRWITPLNNALVTFGLARPRRIAMFLAQAGRESDQFRRLTEPLDLDADALFEVFPGRIADRRQAQLLAHRPVKIANVLYAHRFGNGDERSGDGYRYRGRGLLKAQGRGAYGMLSTEFRRDFLGDPDQLLEPEWACKSAAWYFAVARPCAPMADARNLNGCTIAITGNARDLEPRREIYARALRALGVEPP
jgi:putative chitinase